MYRFLLSSVLSFKNFLGSLVLFMISFERVLLVNDTWFPLAYFYFRSACWSNVDRHILKNPLKLLISNQQIISKLFIVKYLKSLWFITLGFNFWNFIFVTVNIIWWESYSSVSATHENWKLRGLLVKSRSIQNGLSGFL